ncbi:MAG: amidohydrolase [Leptospiraceae bacterium]|nr:amidohydrolase [Leptospiraceae bacterium]MCP5499525.1 amidohydrolase [Leptospiraceae bacterium]
MKKKLSLFILLIGIIYLSYILLNADFPKEKETIYYNGNVITLEDSNPKAEAVLIQDGLIRSVGTNEDILKLQTKNTKLVNMKGKFLLPGFIDPHTHPDISAFLHGMVDLSGFKHKTHAEVWAHFEKSVKQYKKGEWILCKGLDSILIPDLKTPHISYLDKIAPENPVVILSQSLHSYWANTKAFQDAGITKDTPAPSQSSFYEKDERGNLTGLIVEQEAFGPIREAMLKATPKSRLMKNVETVMDTYARRGFTTIVTAGLTSKDKIILKLYEHLSAKKPSFSSSLLSLFGIFPKRKPMPRHFVYLRKDATKLLPLPSEKGDDFFRVAGLKLWYDGSPYTGSMYLEEPYFRSQLTEKELHISSGHRGKALLEKEELEDLIKQYSEDKWQILIHVQGDRAIRESLEAFEKVQKTVDIRPLRHRLEHCLLLDKTWLERMKQVNLSPSLHINHIYYYGLALQDSILGKERTAKILPLRSITDTSLAFSLHADQPMFESEPFSLMATAIQRQTREGFVINPDETIDRLTALKSLTTMAAWQIGMEDKLGSIREGKYADLILLDDNPLSIPIEKLRNIRVLKTLIHGNPVQ